MGAEPYEYLVPFQANVQDALEELRSQVFASGEFNTADLGPATPDEALEMADADGTGSILDIQRIAAEPDFCCAAPFSSDELVQFFGTEKPSRSQVQRSDNLWDNVERGQARYVVLYENEKPSEIYFAGYSFD
jgi:hypothetical protein